jgi:hypothetical protein
MANKKNSKPNLLDPGSVVSGKQMWKAANAATRIELRPSLKAYGRQYKRLKRDQRRDDEGLKRLGNETAGNIRGIYNFAGGQMANSTAAAQQSGAELQQGLADAGTAEAQRMNALQSGVLGDQIQTLAAQGIAPGGSASQDALSQSLANRQVDQSNMSGNWDKLGATLAQGSENTARNMQASTAAQGATSEAAIRTALASRRADTRTQYGEAKREATGKMADVKALFGPTRLNNIMKLRDSERGFVNERAAILAEARAASADRKLSWAELEEEIRSNKAGEKPGGDKGDYEGSKKDLNTLGKNERSTALTALTNMIGKKSTIDNPRAFFNDNDFGLEPKELAQFKKWLNKKNKFGL